MLWPEKGVQATKRLETPGLESVKVFFCKLNGVTRPSCDKQTGARPGFRTINTFT